MSRSALGFTAFALNSRLNFRRRVLALRFPKTLYLGVHGTGSGSNTGSGRKDGHAGYAALVQTFYDNFMLRTKSSANALVSFEALSKSSAYRVLNGPNEFAET